MLTCVALCVSQEKTVEISQSVGALMPLLARKSRDIFLLSKSLLQINVVMVTTNQQ